MLLWQLGLRGEAECQRGNVKMLSPWQLLVVLGSGSIIQSLDTYLQDICQIKVNAFMFYLQIPLQFSIKQSLGAVFRRREAGTSRAHTAGAETHEAGIPGEYLAESAIKSRCSDVGAFLWQSQYHETSLSWNSKNLMFMDNSERRNELDIGSTGQSTVNQSDAFMGSLSGVLIQNKETASETKLI